MRPHRGTSAIATNLAFGLLACLGDEGSVRDVNEIFNLLGRCAVSNSRYLPTFRDNLSGFTFNGQVVHDLYLGKWNR
jgi:hypothetical protein